MLAGFGDRRVIIPDLTERGAPFCASDTMAEKSAKKDRKASVIKIAALSDHDGRR